MPGADITTIVNTIRANGSTEYQARIPVATRDNIQAIGNPLMEYTIMANEFLTALVNKIAFTVVQSKIFENPLQILKKGDKPLGVDIENLYANPANANTYDPAGSTLLSTTKPDVKAEYFRLNRQDQFECTVWRHQLRHAFTSWENLNALIDAITNTLYSGDYIAEFILMKNTIANAVLNQKMITAGVTAVTTEATAKSLIIDIKNISSGMTYPSTAYNAFAKAGGTGNAVTTWTPKANQILIICSDLLNYIDVNVLAAAFNMDKAQFMGRIVEVDNFGSMASIQAVLMDEACLQVWEDMSEMSEFYNPKGLYTTYFWNHWQTYAHSLFANAVAFVTDVTSPNAPAITPAPGATDTVVAGTGEAGSIVFVTIGDEIKLALVATGGAWSATGFTAMTEGAAISAYQVDTAGNKSAAGTSTVTA